MKRMTAISILILVLVTAGPPKATAMPSPLVQHYVVFIVLDAARPSYLSLGQLPHLQDLMHRGTVYERAWSGQLESSTPGVHVTFGTGTLPRENGFYSFQWADPQTRRLLDFRTLAAAQGLEPILARLPSPGIAARLHHIIPGAVSITASSLRYYAVQAMSAGGATYEIYGRVVNNEVVPAFYHSAPLLTQRERASLIMHLPLHRGDEDAFGIRYTLAVLGHVHPRLLMLNLPELDPVGHAVGTDDGPLMTKLMENIDQGIGEIEDSYRAAGLLDRTDFVITADHGMVNSRPARTTDVVRQTAARVHAGITVLDTAAGGISLVDSGKAKAVAEQLVALRPPHVAAIFYRSRPGLHYSYVLASPQRWLLNGAVRRALQHLVDTTAGLDGPDIWMLHREGYTAHYQNLAGIWKGTHGGATWEVQHVPLILAGPGIRSGAISQFPARAIDIAPTLERLLGLPPIKRDGVVLADALMDPTGKEIAAQNAVAGGLSADVEALQAESRADR